MVPSQHTARTNDTAHTHTHIHTCTHAYTHTQTTRTHTCILSQRETTQRKADEAARRKRAEKVGLRIFCFFGLNVHWAAY